MAVQQANITLGTAGHIDHGKTAFIKCLTGCDTDYLKEEKKRGMSIDLGFAPCTIADMQIGIVDVPGHENFIKTMVAGASGIDGVIFVIAADDGIMPQTREHFEILNLLGVRNGIVVLTKIDRIENEQLEIVTAEVKEFFKGTFLDGAPILQVSSVTGQGFDAVFETLKMLTASIEPRRVDGVFRMPIERTFSVKGYGTVVTGIPVSGSIQTNGEVVLLPQGDTGRIKAMQVYNQISDTALAGQCVALNVRHWDHRTIKRGHTVTVPGYFSPERWYICTLQLLDHERLLLKNATQVKLHTGTSEIVATIYLMQGEQMGAGEHGIVQAKLAEPLVTGPGDRFIIRTLSPTRTIGGGAIVESVSHRIKRNRPDILADLSDRAEAVRDERRFVEYCVRHAQELAAPEAELSRRAKVPAERLPSVLEQLIREQKVFRLAGGLCIHRETADEVGQRLVDMVGDLHRASPASPGITAELFYQTSGLSKEVCDGMIELLKRQGHLVERNRRLALAEYRETFTEGQQQLLDQIETLFIQQPFKPPNLEEIAGYTGRPADQVRECLKILAEHQHLVQVAPGLLFHFQAIDRARNILVSYINEQGRLESVKFKYLLDTTRKFAIPLLDYFDRTGVTRRQNNTRYLRKPPPRRVEG